MSDARQEWIAVSFACNHPDNGLPLGRASSVHIKDFEMENTLIGGGNVKVSHDSFPEKLSTGEEGMLFVGRAKVEYLRYVPGFGNWCWDGYAMRWENALVIVNYLMRLKWWRCENGESVAFEKFNAKQSLTLQELWDAVCP